MTRLSVRDENINVLQLYSVEGSRFAALTVVSQTDSLEKKMKVFCSCSWPDRSLGDKNINILQL